MLDLYIKLIQDTEPEVRSVASFKVASMAKLIGSELIVNKLLDSVKFLVSDPSEYTRCAISSVIMEISQHLSKEDSIKHLVPLFKLLLKDTNPTVRLKLISKLGDCEQAIDLDILSESLLPALYDLAVDPK